MGAGNEVGAMSGGGGSASSPSRAAETGCCIIVDGSDAVIDAFPQRIDGVLSSRQRSA